MQINKLIVFMWLVVIVLFAGCATTTAPWKWLSGASETQSQAYGGWFQTTETVNPKVENFAGELIASQNDSVFILTGLGLKAIAWEQITRAKVTMYDSKANQIGIWTSLGTLSTMSHGWFFLLSAPVWITTGTIFWITQSYKPQLKYPNKSKEDFRKYARFPQGLNESIDRTTLIVKGK
jgi:hypothetical protein